MNIGACSDELFAHGTFSHVRLKIDPRLTVKRVMRPIAELFSFSRFMSDPYTPCLIFLLYLVQPTHSISFSSSRVSLSCRGKVWDHRKKPCPMSAFHPFLAMTGHLLVNTLRILFRTSDATSVSYGTVFQRAGKRISEVTFRLLPSASLHRAPKSSNACTLSQFQTTKCEAVNVQHSQTNNPFHQKHQMSMFK